KPSSPAAPRSQPTPRRPWRGCSPTAPASSPSPPARRPGRPPRTPPPSTARPKAHAGQSIAKLHGLGVTVKVITGDNPVVAAKVCRDIGLDLEDVHTGAEMERLDDDALAVA